MPVEDEVGESLHHQLGQKKDQPERNHDNSLMCLMMGKIELNGQLEKLNSNGLKLDSSQKDGKRKFPTLRNLNGLPKTPSIEI